MGTIKCLRKAFSLVEMLVVIGIIGILIALASAGMSRFVESSRAVQCFSNLRQLGLAVNQWSGENGNMIPATSDYSEPSWMKLIAPYLGLTGTEARADIFRCPGDPSKNPVQPRTYRYNLQNSYYSTNSFNFPLPGSRKSRLEIKHPSSYVMLFDVAYVGTTYLGLWDNNTEQWIRNYDLVQFPPTNAGSYPRPHYNGKAINVLFYDGHTEKMSYPLPNSAYYFDYDR